MSVRELPRQVARRPRSSRRAGPRPFPFSIILSGLPGTGKSTLARGLSRRLGATIVESDAVRLSLSPTPTFSAVESAGVFDLCHARIARLLGRSVPVILDATSLKNAHRLVPLRIAEQAGASALIVAHRRCGDADGRCSRATGTARGRGRLIVDGLAGVFAHAGERERIRRPHVIVDGSGDADLTIEEIVTAVERTMKEGTPR